MTGGAKLAAYALVLAAVLGGGAALGAAAGPLDVGGGDGHAASGGHGDEPAAGGSGRLPAGGLLVSQDGYTLVPEDRLADAGRFAFTVVGPDGRAVERYDTVHDRDLHLIVASRDLARFAHLHPERQAGGRWAVELPALGPGWYRAFADFRPAGADQLTLGVDLVAPGSVEAPPALEPRRTDRVDGLDVELAGDLAAGEEAVVTVTVRRSGEVVTTDPYLGAAGHLVALRQGDLAYLPVHPLDDEPAGRVRFAVEVPSPGAYALFFDFLVDGTVRTARFALEAAAR
ncbi:MAG: hypothetical protein ACLGIO_02800 [Acidimicrobiia bacterium]